MFGNRGTNRPFRSLGARLRDFSVSRINRYTPPGSNLVSRSEDGRPRPFWERDTEAPDWSAVNRSAGVQSVQATPIEDIPIEEPEAEEEGIPGDLLRILELHDERGATTSETAPAAASPPSPTSSRVQRQPDSESTSRLASRRRSSLIEVAAPIQPGQPETTLTPPEVENQSEDFPVIHRQPMESDEYDFDPDDPPDTMDYSSRESEISDRPSLPQPPAQDRISRAPGTPTTPLSGGETNTELTQLEPPPNTPLPAWRDRTAAVPEVTTPLSEPTVLGETAPPQFIPDSGGRPASPINTVQRTAASPDSPPENRPAAPSTPPGIVNQRTPGHSLNPQQTSLPPSDTPPNVSGSATEPIASSTSTENVVQRTPSQTDLPLSNRPATNVQAPDVPSVNHPVPPPESGSASSAASRPLSGEPPVQSNASQPPSIQTDRMPSSSSAPNVSGAAVPPASFEGRQPEKPSSPANDLEMSSRPSAPTGGSEPIGSSNSNFIQPPSVPGDVGNETHPPTARRSDSPSRDSIQRTPGEPSSASPSINRPSSTSSPAANLSQSMPGISAADDTQPFTPMNNPGVETPEPTPVRRTPDLPTGDEGGDFDQPDLFTALIDAGVVRSPGQINPPTSGPHSPSTGGGQSTISRKPQSSQPPGGVGLNVPQASSNDDEGVVPETGSDEAGLLDLLGLSGDTAVYGLKQTPGEQRISRAPASQSSSPESFSPAMPPMSTEELSDESGSLPLSADMLDEDVIERAPAASSTPAAAGGDKGGPNIEKLARDVYNILRDRLRIEQERRSGK